MITKNIFIAAIVCLFFSGCFNLNPITPPPTPTSTNEFYFMKDGVKYDLGQNADTYYSYGGMTSYGGIIGQNDNIFISIYPFFGYPVSAFMSGFPIKCKIDINQFFMNGIQYKSVSPSSTDTLNNYYVVDSAFVVNGDITYIKGSFKGECVTSGVNSNPEQFFIEGKFDIKTK